MKPECNATDPICKSGEQPENVFLGMNWIDNGWFEVKICGIERGIAVRTLSRSSSGQSGASRPFFCYTPDQPPRRPILVSRARVIVGRAKALVSKARASAKAKTLVTKARAI